MTSSFVAANSVVKFLQTGLISLVRLPGYLVLLAVLSACTQQASSEQELLDRARLAAERGDARAAVIDVRTALQQNPENFAARQMLGELYIYQHEPVLALEEFERALSIQEDEALRVIYARALLTAARSERLLELTQQGAFASVADNPHYLTALARAQAQAGNQQAAMESMDAALQTAADDPYVSTTNAFFLLLYSVTTDDAEAALQETLAMHPDHAEAWSLLGDIQQMGGELALAEDSYVRATELNPYRLVDRLNLVGVRMDQGKTAEAEAELRRLLASNPNHPGVKFLEGRMLIESGDTTGALAAFFEVLNVVPTHPGSLYLSAIANIQEGNHATALDQLNRFLAGQPSHLNARLLLTNLHLLMDNPQAAEGPARAILEQDYMNYPAMGLLATALSAQGETNEEIIDLYQRMAAARPDIMESQLESEATRLLTEARTDYPEEPGAWLLLTEAFLEVGDLESASEAGEHLLGLLPEDPIVLGTVARIEIRSGRFNAAENLLHQALAGQPDNEDFSKLLMDALMAQGKLEEATAVLAGLPEHVRQEPAVRVASGRMALAANRPAEAESDLRSALEETPATMTVLWLSGAIAAQGRNDEAIRLLDDWLVDYPADVLVRNRLASIHLNRGNEAEAREHYQRLLDNTPDNVLVLNNLAWLLRADDPQQALVHIEKANQLIPDNPQIMDTYAMVQLERSAWDESLSLNQRALDLMPNNPQFLYHRALILQAAGQRENAIQILEGLVSSEDNPQRGEAQNLLAELEGF